MAAGESDGAHQGQGGPVVAQGGFAFEVAYRLQNAGTEQLSTSRRCTLQELSDTLQAEFPTGMSVLPLAVDHSAGDEQQNGAFFQAHGWSIGGGVGEESERQASRSQVGDPIAVSKEAGRVSGVGVADGAELLVVAGDKGRTRADALRGFQYAAIDAKTKLRHGFGFVDVRTREELSSEVAKDFLCSGKDTAVVLA